MYGYVDANQFSPRISATYDADPGHDDPRRLRPLFHAAGISLSAPTNLAEFAGTTQQPGVQSRRSGSAGAVEQIRRRRRSEDHAGPTAGLDAYYKVATDLLDDGQFGQALTLTAFNYAQGWNEGVEAKVEYHAGDFRPMRTSPGATNMRPTSSPTSFSSIPPSSPISPITAFRPTIRRPGPARPAPATS